MEVAVTVRLVNGAEGGIQTSRTDLALEKDAPESRAIQTREAGIVVELQQMGGLHHRYERRAA